MVVAVAFGIAAISHISNNNVSGNDRHTPSSLCSTHRPYNDPQPGCKLPLYIKARLRAIYALKAAVLPLYNHPEDRKDRKDRRTYVIPT